MATIRVISYSIQDGRKCIEAIHEINGIKTYRVGSKKRPRVNYKGRHLIEAILESFEKSSMIELELVKL